LSGIIVSGVMTNAVFISEGGVSSVGIPIHNISTSVLVIEASNSVGAVGAYESDFAVNHVGVF